MSEASPTGVLKISDFGLSRFLGTDSLADTHVGTPLYMVMLLGFFSPMKTFARLTLVSLQAPEIFQPVPYTDKADLWSVGVIGSPSASS